jgi:hypothetical protein
MPGRRALIGWVGLALLGLGPAPQSAVRSAATATPAPVMALVPTCGPPAPTQPGEVVLTYSIEVVARNLGIYGVYIVFNPGAAQRVFSATPDAKGSLDQVVHPPLAPPGTYTVQVQDLDYVAMTSAQFVVPCPPPRPSPSVPPASPGPPRVLNPTLTLSPAVGPPGTVTVARGAGFPAGVPIQLGWSEGIVSTTATAIVTDGSGSFTATVLIFPHDELGTRVLTAVSAVPPNSSLFGFASAFFLVVPGEAQPRDFTWRR